MPAPDLDRAYTDHAASVFAFALTLTRAEGDAREVLQDVFVKLAGLHDDEGIRDLRSYLLKVTHHCTIDRLRREGTHQRAMARLTEETSQWFAPAADADTTAFRFALSAALAPPRPLRGTALRSASSPPPHLNGAPKSSLVPERQGEQRRVRIAE